MNTVTLSIFIYRSHCYNKEMVPVGTHLNFYYTHDSFPFCFYCYWLQAVYFVHTSLLVCLYVIFLLIKPLGIKKCNSILQTKVMLQQWNSKLWAVKMNTKLQSTNTVSQCVHITSYVNISTVIKKMFKNLAKNI
jgi:hypothetical protein